jgi:hypothetical protein
LEEEKRKLYAQMEVDEDERNWNARWKPSVSCPMLS